MSATQAAVAAATGSPSAVSAVESKLDSILASLEAKAKAEESKIATWLKDKWPHFVTWAAVAAPYILKYL